MKYGDIFRKKYGKDPLKLTIREIETIAIKDKHRSIRYGGRLIDRSSNVFRQKFYDIEGSFKRVLKRIDKWS